MNPLNRVDEIRRLLFNGAQATINTGVGMQEMTALQVSEYLQQGNTPPFLLDVREQWEYKLCHIEGAKLIPMHKVPNEIAQLDPEQEIIVICHHGVRSRMVAQFLEQAQFKNVINLAGGMAQWASQVDTGMATY